MADQHEADKGQADEVLSAAADEGRERRTRAPTRTRERSG